MSNYSSIRATIDANIKTNNNQEITGVVLNSVLNEMIDSLGAGYLFKGIATTSTNPGSPDEKVFYIAGETGTYTNFSNLVAAENELTILYYDTAWHKSVAQITTEHPVAVTNTPEESRDFEIADENDNILAIFEGGGFKVKNFDTSQIKADITLSKFQGKKIAIIGDSISTFQGWLPSSVSGYDGTAYETFYPYGNVTAVSQTWWHIVARRLGLTPADDINNCSWSGSRVSTTKNNVSSDSTTNAGAGCSTRRISDLSIRGWNPDIVIVYISCNDWANNIAVGTWKVSDPIPSDGLITNMRSAYALMLSKIQASYPSARIFCCTNLDDRHRDNASGWPSDNANGVTTYEWNQNIIELAEAFGCEVINLHSCGLNYANIATYAVDSGLHPNVAGMQFLADKVYNELITKY